ncbi:MAG TPA: tetratricopeptide repeat protein [Gemmatimonadales bacterium]|nr:tetratricopeptide repeat protein [Gemmatimonadales bacterium]
MRTTASYELFPDAPSEREMARARWLAREGRLADAEAAYREVLQRSPDLKPCWAEYFELLRGQGRAADALRLAEAAQAHFADSAFALALTGAALIELERYRDALGTLERAVEADPDLGLVWHELGYAAYRLGDRNRALLAIDRAFALEPHTETLKLRGRILRDAGRYQAAEVAFEGASQAAEHPEQRAAAEREILVTRRYALYAPRRPDELRPGEQWFADSGAVILAPDSGPVAPSDEALMVALTELIQDSGWRFGQIVAVGPTLPLWSTLAETIGAPLVARAGFDVAAVPLVVAVRPLAPDTGWNELAARTAAEGSGLVFVLEHPAETPPPQVQTDVAGVLTDGGIRRARMPSVAHALSEAQHPATRFAGRRLRHS